MGSRRRWTHAECAEMWRLWKNGLSLREVGEALGRPAITVYNKVAHHGGVAPSDMRRHPRVLSLAEREAISRRVAAGDSLRAIAREVGRAPSTISREMKRNGGRHDYRAWRADQRAWDCALRFQDCKLAQNPRLQRIVARKLQQEWSPGQISGWLKRRYPGDARMQVSHETIYRSLFLQARHVLKRELLDHLRTARSMRKARSAAANLKRRPRIAEAFTIHARPPEAADRAIPGHWEGDLLQGDMKSAIATLVERRSRYTMLVKIPSKKADVVAAALARHVRRLPAELRRSLTWDRGTEMAGHQRFTVASDVKVFFCDPASPWQRGTNENTNGLLRQYFPKGVSLTGVSQAHLNLVAKRLNQRPRKTLGFRTPAEVFASTVALTD